MMKFMQIKPQKARGKFSESLWTDQDWVLEPKYDGDRRIAQFTVDAVRFTGTRQSVRGDLYVEKTENLPHLKMPWPALVGTVLDGEIIAPYAKLLLGGKSKYVTAVMGSAASEALRKQEKNGWLEYRVFDCLWYLGIDVRGRSLPYRQRLAREALRTWGNAYAEFVDQYDLFKKSWYEKLVAEGGEGGIFKNIHSLYGDESAWVKVKAEATADVVVTGFVPGKGKYIGQVGAIEFGQYVSGKLTVFGTCSGFDDALRTAMRAKPHYYKGRVLRIKHNGREPTGAFRHPRFDGWRDDKEASACVFDVNES